MTTTWGAGWALLRRDMRLGIRQRSEIVMPLMFLVLVCTLFPLGLGPDIPRLREIAPAVIWIAALLSSLLALNHLFAEDFADGSLEQLVVSEHPLPWLMMSKVLAHWLISGLPIVLLSPVLAFSYQLPADGTAMLFITLLLGTPTLSLIGAIGVALTVGLRRGGMFLALLVLPLFVPVLIFATAGVVSTVSGLPDTSHVFFLTAMLVLALTLAPFAVSAALKISLS
ncbi:MAG: heme exporter protein CcmB [Xanthomonadales bacterium]|nr:heme exporter protein CcmB [Xanthomonadales bacterium]